MCSVQFSKENLGDKKARAIQSDCGFCHGRRVTRQRGSGVDVEAITRIVERVTERGLVCCKGSGTEYQRGGGIGSKEVFW